MIVFFFFFYLFVWLDDFPADRSAVDLFFSLVRFRYRIVLVYICILLACFFLPVASGGIFFLNLSQLLVALLDT